ncbi:MAG: MmcQ/YjbR family DNA-binding protein [Gemmatimonadota bacterium]|nr:MmcQ/YjbR family DNA-binding protein [Gemmatimonadota bacterium]
MPANLPSEDGVTDATPKRSGVARVHAIASTLPDVEPGSSYGYAAFKVSGKTFAWFPDKKEVEKGTLGVRMSIMEREYLIARNPQVYYFTAHYKDYDAVLARVDLMPDAELRELLESGHEFMVKLKKKRR